MKAENAKCPNCGACLIVDTILHKGKCMYCGGEIMYEDAVAKIKVDGIADFDDYLLSAQNELQFGGDFDKAKDYYKLALRLRPNDYRASWGIFLCEMQSIIYHHNRKGFVQIPGDTKQEMANNIARYGKRAETFAPDDVKKYYEEIFDYYLSQL